MTESQFQTELGRLSRVFGDKSYSTDRTQLIWREVGTLPAELFAHAVETLIGECRQPPLLPEIRDAVAREREKQRAREPREDAGHPWDRPHDCNYCYDTGVMLCEHRVRELDGPYAFRCACPIGLRDPRTQVPHFTAAHSSEYVFLDVRTRLRNVAVVPA